MNKNGFSDRLSPTCPPHSPLTPQSRGGSCFHWPARQSQRPRLFKYFIPCSLAAPDLHHYFLHHALSEFPSFDLDPFLLHHFTHDASPGNKCLGQPASSVHNHDTLCAPFCTLTAAATAAIRLFGTATEPRPRNAKAIQTVLLLLLLLLQLTTSAPPASPLSSP
jgi:hypothetical protein